MEQDSCCRTSVSCYFCDVNAVQCLGIGDFHRVVSDVHHRLSDFINEVVVHRRYEAIREWRNWIREDPWCIPIGGFVLIWFHLLPFFNASFILLLMVLVSLQILAGIDEEFRKAWLPYFCRSGQRDTSLEEFDLEVEGWLPLLPEVDLPRLTGQVPT